MAIAKRKPTEPVRIDTKTNDTLKVLCGRDKGKSRRVLALNRDSGRVLVKWTTALAGSDPIRSYKIYAGDNVVATVPYRPQLGAAPLSLALAPDLVGDAPVRVEASTELPPW